MDKVGFLDDRIDNRKEAILPSNQSTHRPRDARAVKALSHCGRLGAVSAARFAFALVQRGLFAGSGHRSKGVYPAARADRCGL